MQKYKIACENLSKQVFNLTNNLNDMENHFLEFKSEIAGRVLGNEIIIEKLGTKKDASMDKLCKRVDIITTKIGNLPIFENVNKRLDEDIAQANNKIESNIENLKSIADGVRLISSNANLYHPSSKSNPDTLSKRMNNPLNAQFNSDMIFNHDVVFLVDSNLKKIIPEKMDSNSTCARFYCPRLCHINSLLDTVDIQRNPNKIFIHCGTNHIYIVVIKIPINWKMNL